MRTTLGACTRRILTYPSSPCPSHSPVTCAARRHQLTEGQEWRREARFREHSAAVATLPAYPENWQGALPHHHPSGDLRGSRQRRAARPPQPGDPIETKIGRCKWSRVRSRCQPEANTPARSSAVFPELDSCSTNSKRGGVASSRGNRTASHPRPSSRERPVIK